MQADGMADAGIGRAVCSPEPDRRVDASTGLLQRSSGRSWQFYGVPRLRACTRPITQASGGLVRYSCAPTSRPMA